MDAPAFSQADLDLLLEHYTPSTNKDGDDTGPHAPPWSFAARSGKEIAALGRLIDVYVATYNRMLATTVREIVPPCWRHHPGLAHDLAVQVWLYYAAFLHDKATPSAAADFHTRHLPAFRARIDGWLGRSPGECRKGNHPTEWRKDLDSALDQLDHGPTTTGSDEHAEAHLSAMHFGFSHVGDHTD